MTETVLEQCQRHVTEGGARIARQEELISELERDGHEDMLASARALLAQMEEIQQSGEEHLARELGKLAIS